MHERLMPKSFNLVKMLKFAVVADEVRKLADQSKQSTEVQLKVFEALSASSNKLSTLSKTMDNNLKKYKI